MTQAGKDSASNPELLKDALDGSVLRQRAEDRWQSIDSQSAGLVTDLSPEANRVMLHELQVHQIELEMQNEELRRVRDALEASRERYVDLYDLAPVGYCSVNEKGLMVKLNLTCAKLLGLPRAALVSQPLSRFILNEDQDVIYRLRARLMQALAEPSLQGLDSDSCELRMVRDDGTPFWALLVATVVRDTAEVPGEAAGVGAVALRLTVTDMTERKHIQTVLEQSLQDKEALLKEVHHRVKNNLQVIMSLLRLERGRRTQTDTQEVLDDMQGRIRSMALLHESLYRKGTFASVDLGSYLRQIATQVLRSQVIDAGAVELTTDMATVFVGMDQAAPCGLLLNELVSNCLKHGFPSGRRGELAIGLQPFGDAGQWRLQVNDNGVGLPADFEDRRRSSLGLQLTADLVKQIDGNFVISAGAQCGTLATVTFSPQKLADRSV